MGSVLDIPGYKDALEREALVRDASFLPVTERVAGHELVPMTLRHFLILRVMRSPFLFGGTPTPEQLGAFLWLLSPHYSHRLTLIARWHRSRIMRKLRKLLLPVAPLWHTKRNSARHERRIKLALFRAYELVTGLRDYVEENLQDMQPHGTPVGSVLVEHYSDGAAICATFAREYGWSEEAVLSLPMSRLLQYTKEIRLHHGTKTPLCNPSDAVRAKWMEDQNRGAVRLDGGLKELNKTMAPVSFTKPPLDGVKA